MARAIINKHIDNSDNITREHFLSELDKAKGEILINNDAENPSIFIVTNDNEVAKISGANKYDDTELRNEISNVKESIDNYTINNKPIKESPIINTDDIKVSDTYSTLDKNKDNILPGDFITEAMGKIELMLTNTTLAVTAALNDLERKIGNPSEKDNNGEITKKSTGLFKRIEDLENNKSRD